MQNAIEAAAEALFEESQGLDQDNNWDDALPDEWRQTWLDAAESALYAMLPHLRATIAQEILDHVDDIPLNGLPYYRDGIYAGMVSAALLVREPQL